MNTFETPVSIEMTHESDRSDKDRDGILERLASKYPRLRSLIAAFVITSAGLVSPEIAAAKTKPEAPQVISYHLKSPDKALKKIQDPDFKSAFVALREAADGVITEAPIDAIYSYRSRNTTVNKKTALGIEEEGRLSEFGEKVMIEIESFYGRISGVGQNYGRSGFLEAYLYESSLHISPAGDQELKPGQAFEVDGVGATKEQAVRFALENAVVKEMMERTHLHSERAVTSDQKHPFSEKQILTDQFESEGKCVLIKYAVKDVERYKRDGATPESFRVTVEVTSAIPAQESNE